MIKLDTGKLAVAVVPVPEKLSLKAAAAALGAGKAVMADRTEAERSTGLRLRRHLTARPAQGTPDGRRRVGARLGPGAAAARGRRGLEIELAPADLVRLTGAVTAAVVAG